MNPLDDLSCCLSTFPGIWITKNCVISCRFCSITGLSPHLTIRVNPLCKHPLVAEHHGAAHVVHPAVVVLSRVDRQPEESWPFFWLHCYSQPWHEWWLSCQSKYRTLHKKRDINTRLGDTRTQFSIYDLAVNSAKPIKDPLIVVIFCKALWRLPALSVSFFCRKSQYPNFGGSIYVN